MKKSTKLTRLVRVSDWTIAEINRLQVELKYSSKDGVIRQLIHEHKTVPFLRHIYGTVGTVQGEWTLK